MEDSRISKRNLVAIVPKMEDVLAEETYYNSNRVIKSLSKTQSFSRICTTLAALFYSLTTSVVFLAGLLFTENRLIRVKK